MTQNKTNMKSVTRAAPCAVCGGNHKCSRGSDGLILCGRQSGPVSGFVDLGKCKGDEQFAMYRREGDPFLVTRQNGQHNGKFHNGTSHTNGKPIDWTAKAKQFARNLQPSFRAQLAQELGLPEKALAAIPDIGWNVDEGGEHWTLPEADGQKNVTGISRRYINGEKKSMKGSKRGITIPPAWDDTSLGDTIFIVEGPSDVLALTWIGLRSLGRPSNTGGAQHLADLLRQIPEDQRPMVVVIGEYDPKPDGTWPGRDGAVKVAGELAKLLGDKWVIRWALPPNRRKDVRSWLLTLKLDPTCEDEWHEAGPKLIAAIAGDYQSPTAVDVIAEPIAIEAIDSETFAATKYELSWLVRQILIADQPAIMGGSKKSLKTSLLCDLAISIGAGLPFLGEFHVERPVRIGFLSGESGPHTIQDTARNICRARGTTLSDANVWWGFTLPQLSVSEHLDALREAIEANDLRAIILDPLYLCLLSGNSNAQAGNLFDMGPLLAGIARVCLDAGATPILCHHNVKHPKNPAKEFAPPELEDLAFAGIQEFARQWLLVGRSEA